MPRDCSHAAQPGLEFSGKTSHHRWTGPCPGLACARAATLRAQMLQGAQKFFGAGEGLGGGIRKSRQEAPRRETRQRPACVETGAQHSLRRTPGRRPSPLAFTLHVGELTGRLQGPSQTRRPANGLRRWTPGPAWALPQHRTRSRAHGAKGGEERMLCLCRWHLWLPLTPGFVPSSPTPSLAQVTLGRPARPPRCSGVPLQKELEGVASGSLQAPRCQDFLSQWMGTQETQGPRLVLFGVSIRLEKYAVSTGSGPSFGLAPGSGHSRRV